MRESVFDYGWMLADDGRLVGLSLGYDRCAEHEWGIDPLLDAMGIAVPRTPVGVSDRQMTLVPEHMGFAVFQQRQRDKRRKAYPAAVLWVTAYEHRVPKTEPWDGKFYGDPTDAEPRSHMRVQWGSKDFCVYVRGAENIERLKLMHEALQSKDVAIGLPWAKSFFRGGLALVRVSAMTSEELQAVEAQDLAHKKLVDAAQATGIEDELKAAGKGWYALSPDWVNRETQTEVMFFLNPQKQSAYHFGWFTVDELRQWAQEKGPVIRYAALDSLEKAPQYYNWSCRLIEGLRAKGILLRRLGHLTWFDDAKTIPGLYLDVSPSSTSDAVRSGLYPFDEILSQHATALVTATSVAA